jgi:hypothetical protein
MSISNYIHINHSTEFARVRNDILKILSDNRDGLTLSEISLKLGIKRGCSQDTVHQHLKYCAKTGKVGTPKVANRGVVYKFLGYFQE